MTGRSVTGLFEELEALPRRAVTWLKNKLAVVLEAGTSMYIKARLFSVTITAFA